MPQDLFHLIREFMRNEREIEERQSEEGEKEEAEFEASLHRKEREPEPEEKERTYTLQEISRGTGLRLEEAKEVMKEYEEHFVHVPHLTEQAQTRYGLMEHIRPGMSYQPGLNF